MYADWFRPSAVITLREKTKVKSAQTLWNNSNPLIRQTKYPILSSTSSVLKLSFEIADGWKLTA